VKRCIGWGLAAIFALGCNQLTSLDDLQFDGPGAGGASVVASTGAAGGTGGTSGPGGSGGAGAAAGAGGVGGAADSYAATVLADSPLGYWRLDDTSLMALDSSGNGHHGSYQGGLLQEQPGVLAGNAAATFADNNDHIEIPGPFGFTGTTPFSVEAWFVGSAPQGQIVSKMSYDGMAYSGWFLSTAVPPTSVRFNRLVASGSGIDGGTIVPDQWHHVVAVFDGTTALLYLDGVKVNDITQSGDLAAVTPSVRIGDGDTWGNFQGTIDEVAIYDQALSASRIAAHYAAAVGPTP
jgi:hypothetical protein